MIATLSVKCYALMMLTPHPHAALEYWYFKVNVGSTALLVDWIARRKKNEQLVRVSIHSPHKREVVWDTYTTFSPDDRNFMTLNHTAGKVDDVEWDLKINIIDNWFKPVLFPSEQVRVFDSTLTSTPMVTFTGWIRHGSHRVELKDTPGMMAQYWGRRLCHEWWWVSASQFDREDTALECMVIKSRLWNMPIIAPLAYLYLRTGNARRLWIAPPGLAQAKGTPEAFEIQFRMLNSVVRLVAKGREYGDLGDQIINTLVGDVEIWDGDKLLASAKGTAGLERRRG
jgi:hypothetical protein